MQRVPSGYDAEVITLLLALKAFAYCFVHNSYDAEDLVQETVAKAFTHIDQFDGREGGLRNWTFTIMRKYLREQYKRAQREPLGVGADVAILDVPMAETQNRTMHVRDVE